jgi:hypothetical protein
MRLAAARTRNGHPRYRAPAPTNRLELLSSDGISAGRLGDGDVTGFGMCRRAVLSLTPTFAATCVGVASGPNSVTADATFAALVNDRGRTR